MSGKRESGDGLLIALAFFIGIAFYGPTLAKKFAGSVGQMVVILSPIVGTMMGVVFVALLVKRYWNRY